MDQRIAVRYAQAAMSPPALANCLTRPLQDRAPDNPLFSGDAVGVPQRIWRSSETKESTVDEKSPPAWTPMDQGRSNKSRFITLSHADTKSRINFSSASSLA